MARYPKKLRDITEMNQQKFTASPAEGDSQIRRTGMGDIWPVPENLLVDLDIARRFILVCCVTIRPEFVNIHQELVISSIISYAKRGAITSQKLNRIVNDVATVSGKDLHTSTEAIKRFLQFTSKYTNDNNVPFLFQHLHSASSEENRRLRLTLEQTKYSGLTSMMVIGI